MKGILAASILALCVGGCGKSGDSGQAKAPAAAKSTAPASQAAARLDHPGTRAGAEALLRGFLAPGADHGALSLALRPTTADYAAVYGDELAGTLETMYAPAWEAKALVIKPKEGQTELLLWSATAADLKAGQGDAGKFPGGYSKVAAQLRDGVTLYRFKFVKPGETLGMAFDGLVHVNGRWVIIPKPWRALR